MAGGVHIDAHVDDHLAGGEAVGTDNPGPSSGDDQQLCPTAFGRQIGGAGVAEGDGGVPVQQQHSCRPSDDQTAPHHHGAPAGRLKTIVVQQFQAGLSGAGGITLPVTEEYTGQGTAGDAIHILDGGEGGTHRRLVQVSGQRTEKEAAVNGPVLVDPADDRQQFLLGAIDWQDKMLYRNSDHFTALAGPTLVGEILRPLSHPDDGQGGRNAAGPQPLRLSAQAFGERGGHWRTLPELRHQVYLPITDS